MADRPSDLIDVPQDGNTVHVEQSDQQPQQGNAPVSVRPLDLTDVDPDYVSKQINPYNTVTGVTTGAAVVAPTLEQKILGNDPHVRRSLETYLRTQRHHDYPGLDLKGLEQEWKAVAGSNARIVTMEDVQDALKATRSADLSAYRQAPQPTTQIGRAAQPIKKLGEFTEQLNPFLGHGYGSRAFRGAGRAGLGFGAAYEGAQAYNKALEGDYSGAAGSASTGAGLGLMAVPHPVAKGAGVILAGVPLAANLMGSAQAAPMTSDEASGAAFDIGTGLLGPAGMAIAPSQLAPGTVQPKREVYRPGLDVLHGSRLQPQEDTSKALLHFAEGGSSNDGAPFIGYPHIKNKPNDPNFVQQSGGFLGGLDAVLGVGKRDDVSMLTPEGQAYHDAYEKYEPVGIAANIAPFLGGPMKAIGKATLKSLGPKAAEMAENYLAKIGGVQYAVPPTGKYIAPRSLVQPTAEEIAQFQPKETRDVKFSDALQNHLNEYLGLHMSDPYGTHGGRMGGTGFGNFQNINPLHAKNKVVWMNDSEEAAKKLAGQQTFNGSPIVWSNYIGSPTQHVSNKSVANEILQDVYKSHPNMAPDVVGRTNEMLMKKFGVPNLDIRDRDAMSELLNRSFEARKQFGHLAQGFGAGKNKVVLSPNWQNILDESRDPFIAGANTSEIGTRLSRIHQDAPQFSTEFHPDYRWTVHGEDLGVRFPSVPQEVAVPDWYNTYKSKNFSKTGKPLEPHGNAWFSYMKTPQKIDEDYIKSVQAAGYAPGGKVLSTLGKSLAEAKAAYKAQFTPGFYHGSPSPNIKAFDSLKKKDPDFAVPGVTFVTRDPDFAESFLPTKGGSTQKMGADAFVNNENKYGVPNYKTGATMYPVNVNLGKHFDPTAEEAHDVIMRYTGGKDNLTARNIREGSWTAIEHPDFLNHLRNEGFDTFTAVEGGIPNVGIFNPKNIRGKFAKFNPEDAASPDFMKAEGGSIQHYQVGSSVLKPMVNRLSMHFKDVTKRIPELQRSAQDLLAGQGSREAHEALVNMHKPVLPFNFVPTPATREEAVNALHENKKALYGVPSQTLQAGHPVGLRLDIPAYSNHGVWVPTVHEQGSGFGAGKSIGHESVASVLNPAFGMSEKAALNIAGGKDKATIATIKGEWNPIENEAAVANAQEYLNHPDWRQVGMDPERHAYFYDRASMEPIVSAEEALQIGPLVLAKKPVYGKKEDYKFKKGGKAKKK